MSVSSIITLVVSITLLVVVVIGFAVLFKKEKTTNLNVRVVPLCSAANRLLKDRGENRGVRLTQKELLEKTDYVLMHLKQNEQ